MRRNWMMLPLKLIKRNGEIDLKAQHKLSQLIFQFSRKQLYPFVCKLNPGN